MIGKLPELEINAEKPFENCKLEREPYANILSNIVENYHDGCVIAIDGEWGTGKSTFVKMWKQMLINNGFKTLYFNVWENDFIEDPFVLLTQQLISECSEEKAKKKVEQLVHAGASVFWGSFASIVKGVAKHKLGDDAVDEILDVVEATSDSTAKVFKQVLDNAKKQTESIESFKNSLISLVEEYTDQKPMVFIVDELDRCNPHFAVKVLERIKHLFNIPNIVFVLSIDKKSLCSSIKGYYGSESINADEYLKRFIDIEYTLPEPRIESFCKYLYEVYGFSDIINHFQDGKQEEGTLLYFSQQLIKELHLNLRQMERLFAHVRLVRQSYGRNMNDNVHCLFLLICLKKYYTDIYDCIRKGSSSIQELIDTIETHFPAHLLTVEKKEYSISLSRNIIRAFAKILWHYSCGNNGYNMIELIKTETVDGQEKTALSFRCKKFNEDILTDALNYFRNREGYSGVNIWIENIELLENMICLTTDN